MDRLKKRADFLRAAKGVRRVEGAITLAHVQHFQLPNRGLVRG